MLNGKEGRLLRRNNDKDTRMKINILLCDDDKDFLQRISDAVAGQPVPPGASICITKSSNPAEITDRQLSQYHIMFLDIDMDERSGIYTSYLHGDSLQTIKSKVEAGGYKTVRGNTTWSTQALLRILQNEKYCGDVLLQKTFTDNVLTGGPKKNTGQLPQYYIENNHEGIVTKQMYREVQAEIARRNSKSCTNRRKQKRGRYNSKYALSERLYCGECGSPYKRVTWNIHGRKEIVWRCVNRVTYGTKFCHNSPSVQEEVLHQTLLRAIQNLADNYTDEVAMQINGILHDLQGGTTELEELQQKLADARQEFDRLLDLSLECDASFLDEKLKHASEEIDSLQKQIDQLTASQQKAANPDLQLTVSDFHITKYSDTLVARIIERIDVVSANEIKIEFIGGYTVTAPLQE